MTGVDNLGFNLTSGNGTIVDVEGIGLDPNNRQPWIAVLLDTSGSGAGDRWGIQRYDLASGQPDVDVLISEQFTVPEPASAGLLVLGLAVLARFWRRRR